MKNLFIYNSKSTDPLEIINAAIAKHDVEAVLFDLQSTNLAGQITTIKAYTDNYFENVVALCPVSATGTTLTTLSNIAWAWASSKVKTANKSLITSGTILADTGGNTTTTTRLATADTKAANYYRYMILSLTGGTGFGTDNYRIISAYTAANLATVGSGTTDVLAAAFDGTTTYNIYDVSGCMYQVNNTNTAGNAAYSTYGKTSTYQMWEIVYTGITKPLAVTMLGGYNFVQAKGICTGVTNTATTLILDETYLYVGGKATSAQIQTLDFFKGKFLCLTGGTGAGQIRKITGSVYATDCTITVATFDTTPSTDTVFEIVDAVPSVSGDEKLYCFAELALKYFLHSNLKPATGSVSAKLVSALIDNEGKLSSMVSGTPAQKIETNIETNLNVALADNKLSLVNALYVGNQIIRSLNIANITSGIEVV